MLLSANWVAPQNEKIPTGKDIVEHYLKPLAALPELSPNVHLNTKVTAISRKGLSKVKTSGREKLPFVIHVVQNGSSFIYEARAVIDASGTWSNPNPLRSDGLFSEEEKALNSHISYGIPAVLGKERNRYSGKKVLVVGSGHSAINTLLELVELQKQGEQIHVSGTIKDEQVVIDHIDEIVGNTGSRPDLSMVREVRVLTDPSLDCVYELAPLIDPNIHSCGTVRPHGEKELRQPEKDFYIVGAKSYGRAPTFLMATGYEQVRSIVAALVGDMESAQKVELELPETGVCSLGASGTESCCEPVQVKEASSDCCSPSKNEKAGSNSCCG